MKMTFDKHEFVSIELEDTKFIAIVLSNKKSHVEVLPLFKFDQPELITELIGRISIPRTKIIGYNRITKNEVDNLMYLVGLKHKDIIAALEKAFNEEESYWEN